MEAFEDPRTQNEVKEILLCICRENPEIITHIANPYVRLGIVYVGAISMSLRKDSPQYKQYYGKHRENAYENDFYIGLCKIISATDQKGLR